MNRFITRVGCEKKKFLAALGVEEAKEKVKHRPARDGDKRKKISRAKKSAAQKQKMSREKNKIGVVIDSKNVTKKAE
jgi:hypothetical protein